MPLWRRDLNEKILENDIRIVTSAYKRVDINHISAAFGFNSTHVKCINKDARWADKLTSNSVNVIVCADDCYVYVPCVTSSGLLANFHFVSYDLQGHIFIIEAMIGIQSYPKYSEFWYDPCSSTIDNQTLIVSCESNHGMI